MLRILLAAFTLAVISPRPAAAQDGTLYARKARKKVRRRKKIRRKVRKKVRKKIRRKRKRSTPVIENLLRKGAFGIQVGFNSASVEYDGDPPIDYGSVIGVQAGAVYDKSINRFLGYRVGAFYAQRGFKEEVAGQTKKTETTLSYLHIPAMVTARFKASRTATLFIGVGGYVSTLFGVEQLADGRVKKRDPEGRLISDKLTSLDYGLSLSAGSFFKVTKQMMASVELNYTRGFADLIDHEIVKEISEDFTTETRAWVFSAAVHF